jgi:RNA polymerase sigma factor (TIGR02999 family)
MDRPTENITRILEEHREDATACIHRLVPLMHQHLRRLAHFQLRRLQPGETFCTTVLVHEAYLKIVARERAPWRDRAHFLAASAQAMRHILVDAARQRLTARRGAGQAAEPLVAEPTIDAHAADVLEIHRALEGLARIDERLCRVVECRFFAGMTDEETGVALGVSARTVHRDWLRARAWLKRDLAGLDA